MFYIQPHCCRRQRANPVATTAPALLPCGCHQDEKLAAAVIELHTDLDSRDFGPGSSVQLIALLATWIRRYAQNTRAATRIPAAHLTLLACVTSR